MMALFAEHLARDADIVGPMVAQAAVIGGLIDLLAGTDQPRYV